MPTSPPEPRVPSTGRADAAPTSEPRRYRTGNLALEPPGIESRPVDRARPSTAGRRWLALWRPGRARAARYRQVTGSGASPLVVVEHDVARPRIVAANEAALAAGLTPGMRSSAAHGLVPDLEITRRDPALERASLEALAGWCGQFTSLVSPEADTGLILEIGGSARLFDGLGALAGQVCDGARNLGYTIHGAVAPTPLAAWWLARARTRLEATLAIAPDTLADHLARVPVACLELEPAVLEALHGMGLDTVGDCCRMPRDGLARRLGTALLDRIDRALGHRPDARAPYTAPAGFSRRISFPDEVDDVGVLHEAARRLVTELCGFLRLRESAVHALDLHLAHRGTPATRLGLELVAPTREAAHLHHLLGERLERLVLPAPVLYLGLRAVRLVPLSPQGLALFDDDTAGGDWRTLVERLRARLGAEGVRGLACVADHRPERAWRWCAPGASTPDPLPAPRPLWLLESPRLLAGEGPGREGLPRGLRLLGGPERIESGWWDGADIARDYHVAENERGERFWIYRELREERRWFVHGVFG